MVVNREEAIRVMTNAVEDRSRENAKKNDVPKELAEAMILTVRKETDELHGFLYDVLKDNGVIA